MSIKGLTGLYLFICFVFLALAVASPVVAQVCAPPGGPNPICNDNNPCTYDWCAGSGEFGLCQYDPLPAGTSCPDSDGTLCTQAACNANGVCDQDYTQTICASDGNPCTTVRCEPTTGDCVYPPVAPGVSCPDTDGNLCTGAACDGSGNCDQGAFSVICLPDLNPCTDAGVCQPATGTCIWPNSAPSIPCPDTDNNACTIAGCNGFGVCDQNHIPTVCPDDGNECTAAGICNPTNGSCGYPFLPNSTPCNDTDGNLCTTAGCQAGSCRQNHIVTQCPSDNNECTNDRCDPFTGNCINPPVVNSTPCTDNDGNVCTTAGCEAGICDQSHIIHESLPCNDTDGNDCTTAGCDSSGRCDQEHIFDPVGAMCTDTDGSLCTTPGCDGAGTCEQDYIYVQEYCPKNSMHEPGSMLTFPLIDNIDSNGIERNNTDRRTIINIANTGRYDAVLECYMVTHGADSTEIDEKKDFIIKLSPKEKFWWDTSTPYNRVNANGDRVSIQGFDERKGYLFCWAIDNTMTQKEICYDELKGDATLIDGQRAFNYNAIPSQCINVIGDRILNLDGVEYSMATSQIMFEGFAEDAFGVVDGTLAVAALDLDLIWSEQPEFDINVFCWNEDEVKFSRHLHYKDFAQYDLTTDLQLDLGSIFTEGFQCVTSCPNPLWAIFYQTAGPGLAVGDNVWQHPETGVATRTILPPVPMRAD